MQKFIDFTDKFFFRYYRFWVYLATFMGGANFALSTTPGIEQHGYVYWTIYYGICAICLNWINEEIVSKKLKDEKDI